MAKIERGNHFLSGFGNENFIEEFYMDRGDGLKPSTILSQNEDQYKLEIGVLFIKEKDIRLKLIGNELTVAGSKPAGIAHAPEEKKNFVAVFYIPADVKKGDIAAHFEDGLLTITLPKSEIEQEIQEILLS